jgi:hypothetical protein
MKKFLFLFLIVFIALTAGTSSAEVPYQIGPFILNRPITDCEKYVRMESSLPVRYMEYVHEVEIQRIKGFKSGLIAYSTCEKPRRIVRIKLKYADSSKKFYEKLIKRIEKRYGKSDQYRGDPFNVVVAWKWSFVDKDKNRISMTLQHNSRDEDEKMGNSIKLTLTSKIEEYKKCYEEKLAPASGDPKKTIKPIEITEFPGWELFVPR